MSELKDTTVTGTLKLNKIYAPASADSDTTSAGMADQILTKTAKPMMWQNVITENVENDMSSYYVAPSTSITIGSTLEPIAITTGNVKSYSYNMTLANDNSIGDGQNGTNNVIKYSSAYPFGTTLNTTTAGLTMIPINGVAVINVCALPVGATAVIQCKLIANDYYKLDNQPIYSCETGSVNSPFYLTLASVPTLISPFASPLDGLLANRNIPVPKYTLTSSNNVNTVECRYTNESSSGMTVFVRVTAITAPYEIYKIKQTVNHEYAVYGTLSIDLNTQVNVSRFNPIEGGNTTTKVDESYPAGKSIYKLGTNGNAIIDSAGDFVLDLPNVYCVKKGNYYFKVDENGIYQGKKATLLGNENTDWLPIV